MFTGATRFRIGLLGLGGFLRFFFVRSSGLAYQYLFFDDQLLHHCHHLALRKNRHFLVYWALYQACH